MSDADHPGGGASPFTQKPYRPREPGAPRTRSFPSALGEFASNREQRCPCVLLLDTSGSMEGQPIKELNLGVQEFVRDLIQDDIARMRVELAVVTFGPVNDLLPFTVVQHASLPELQANGDTPMGNAVQHALNLIDARVEEYTRAGIPYLRPYVILITDGEPTDGIQEYAAAADRLKQRLGERKLTFHSIGTSTANFERLNMLGGEQPLRIEGVRYRELFRWLSSSMRMVSTGRVGREAPMVKSMPQSLRPITEYET